MRPDLFIIGAPKCGTSSLYEHLAGHPDVYMSPVKEPYYFSPDVNRVAVERFVHPRDEERYLALFAAARDARRAGEASTRYLASSDAPRLIHDFQPEARIVAMFRDPVEVLHALHNERVANGTEDIVDFAAALAADNDRRAGRRLPPGGTARSSVYRDVVRFGTHLERWLRQFGRQQVHFILLDDLAAAPGPTFRRLLEFLDVDPEYQPETFSARNTSHRRRGAVAALLRVTQAGRAARALLPRVIGTNASHRLRRRLKHSPLFRRRNPRPPLPVPLRDELRRELEPEVILLGELIGRDVRALWWGPPAVPATAVEPAATSAEPAPRRVGGLP